MSNRYSWDEVFTGERGFRDIYAIIYWYLFNKPDFQTHIIETMKRLADQGILNEIPSSLRRAQNLSHYIRKMEKYNLIGRIAKENEQAYGIEESPPRTVYLIALPFYYTDSDCIMTPNAVGLSLEDHFSEYEHSCREFGITDYTVYIFSFELQKIWQEFSTAPEKFMSRFHSTTAHPIGLIKQAFYNLYLVFHQFSPTPIEISLDELDYDIISEEKVQSLLQLSKPEIIAKYDFFGFREEQERLDIGYRPLDITSKFELFISDLTSIIERRI